MRSISNDPPVGPILAISPVTEPNQPKSASPNVELARPSEPITVSSHAGSIVIMMPLMNPPTTAPRRPPVALPKTPAPPPSKKWGTMPGRINATPQAGPNQTAMRPRVARPPTNDEMNPMSAELGPNGNTIGMSSAGFAPGTTRSAMPWKAGTSSPKMIRTP